MLTAEWQILSSSARVMIVAQPGMSAFDGIKEPVQSYVDIWSPMFRQASESGLVPDFLLHWGHGAAMASVLLSMGVIGSYMGWQIRLGNGEDVTPLTLGDTIRVAHPKSEYTHALCNFCLPYIAAISDFSILICIYSNRPNWSFSSRSRPHTKFENGYDSLLVYVGIGAPEHLRYNHTL